MEDRSSWQTQLELKTGKIKKKESKPRKQNKENKIFHVEQPTENKGNTTVKLPKIQQKCHMSSSQPWTF